MQFLYVVRWFPEGEETEWYYVAPTKRAAMTFAKGLGRKVTYLSAKKAHTIEDWNDEMRVFVVQQFDFYTGA